MQFWIFTAEEIAFVWKLLASLSAGIIIGMERELRGKPAGISTHSLVIGGSMIFTALSIHMDPNSPARIAAQVVSGIGFLGAGMILKGKSEKIKISLPREHLVCGFDWHSIGFGWYLIAVVATLYSVLVPLIPRFKSRDLYPHNKD